MELLLRKITADPRCQSRANLCEATVEEYQDALVSGCTFPPVVVFHEPPTYWLAAGFTRREAHLRAGRKTILADVRPGNLRDAILFSVGSNKSHGQRPTPEDKRHAIGMLLADPEWARWSNVAVADACGVSEGLVRDVRRILVQNEDSRLCERNGTTYLMQRPPLQSVPPLEQLRRVRAAEKRPCPRCGNCPDCAGTGWVAA